MEKYQNYYLVFSFETSLYLEGFFAIINDVYGMHNSLKKSVTSSRLLDLSPTSTTADKVNLTFAETSGRSRR